MFFSSLSREQAQHLLPKAQVAVALYRRHNALLAQPSIRENIASIDSDVAALLTLIYDKKQCSRAELITWVNREKQLVDQLQVAITNPQHHDADTALQGAELTERSDIGLTVVGKGNIYKRTLANDVDQLLA